MTSVFVRENIRGLRPFQPGKPIEELRRELGKLGNLDVLKLASNENPIGPSARAIAAARASLDMLSFYPDPNGTELREKLADRLGVTLSQICLGNGSEEILTLAASIGTEPGDEILLTDCAFATYRVIADKVGAKSIVSPMKNWGHDLDQLLARISERSRIIFFANPRNPTGTAVSLAEFVPFMKRVPPRVLVVLDEAYYEYHAPDTDLHGAKLVPHFPNLLVTRTFSKMHGLSGARLGYGVGHPDLIDALNRARMPFTVNRVALAAASAALDDDEHVARSLRVNAAGKAALQGFFDECRLPHLPANGNFVTVLLPFAANGLYARLLRHGLIVRSLDSFGMPGALRVTIGDSAQLARFMRHFHDELRAMIATTHPMGLNDGGRTC
jgi:histidinol-phosphate aminotransferase